MPLTAVAWVHRQPRFVPDTVYSAVVEQLQAFARQELVYLRESVRHGFLAAPPRQFFAPIPATIDSRSPETAFSLYFARRRFVAGYFYRLLRVDRFIVRASTCIHQKMSGRFME
jgi:hypothetical protein